MSYLGLRVKLTVTIALLVVISTGIFAFYLVWEQEKLANESLRTRAKAISLALSAVLIPALDSQAIPPASINDGLRAVINNQDAADLNIISIRVERPDGSEVASYTLKNEALGYPRFSLGEKLSVLVEHDLIYVRSQIHRPQQDQEEAAVLGYVTTVLSRESTHAQHLSSRIGALVMTVIILALTIAISSLIGRSLVKPIQHAAKELNDMSSTLALAAREQEASSAQEAAAVAETRRSMDTLLDSAQKIADRSSEVLGNAERSANGSRQIADRIGNLNELSEKVTEILATIMQVADKADLLALNASLEGTRAGEAGKGFALVATEMRRLAENVVESVAGIRELMKDMREASQAAVKASVEGTDSSTATTHSAREIALLTQEQRQATEQVIASMDEMGDILNQTLNGIQRTTLSASQLTKLANRLWQIVEPKETERRDDNSDRSDFGE